jgi:hypothetical protein
MKKYIMSVVGGILVGVLLVSGSSCVKKTESAVVVTDGGEVQPPVVTGVMTTEPPTISAVPQPVSPQVTDAVTQTPAPQTK